MDHDLKRTVAALNTFGDADKITTAVRRGGHYSLQPYVPACLLYVRMKVRTSYRCCSTSEVLFCL